MVLRAGRPGASLLLPLSPSGLTADSLVDFATQDDLIDYTLRPRRTINEVMYEFRAANVPPEYVFDLLPPIRPRGFSISSSPAVRPSLSLSPSLCSCKPLES